ncbi:hypothetical protein AVEN_109572-1 [Araneus ventricosus]|uniref:Fibronectin type-III domain-containing protein n=1 Tax=Araneus ventricosus TaxID=182803 RepID=A0A4Y2IHY7_ARAVE|nr:hypothetical protein AVEN_109572-1 [Araneus ventricosus]
MNRLNQRSDTTYKINEDKETDGVASDEDSSSIEDSNIAPSDGVASDEDSSSNEDPNIARSDGVGIDKDPLFIEDQNLARSEGIVIDEDSSLIEDQNIARSEEVAIDEDSSLIEDPNVARSDKEASDEDSSLILDLDMADAIRAEERNSKSSEYLRYRKDGDIPNRPRRPAIAHVRRKDIVLTWSAPKTDDGPPAEGYMVEMRDEDGDYKVVGKPATPYLEINKLTPGNIYYFKIKSRNESGHSTPLILKYFMDDEIPAESGEDEDDVSSEEKPEAYIVGKKEGEDIKVTDTPR